MPENHTKGEIHGCIVCGKPYNLYVAYDAQGRFIGSKVMSAGGKPVAHAERALVACDRHTEDEIERAVARVYGNHTAGDDE